MRTPLLLAGTALACVFLITAGCSPNREPAPSSEVIAAVNRGVACMGRYEYDPAVKAFEEALKSDPSLVEARIDLAIAKFNRARKEDRDIEQSGEILNDVLKAHDGSMRAWYFKGIVLQHIGQAEAAIPCFERVVKQLPDNGVAWYLLGLCKQRVGQKSEQEFLKAIELRPYLGSAYYKLWQAYQSEGQMEKGRPYFDKFNQLRENPLNETIELPQYNYMGDLALALPLPRQTTPPITQASYTPQPAQLLCSSNQPTAQPHSESAANLASLLGGAAIADLNHDDMPDIIAIQAGSLAVLVRQKQGGFTNATSGSGLETIQDAIACSLGDYDNDEITDLFLVCKSGNRLFKGKGDATFIDATLPSGISSQAGGSQSALFLDADHDGDLDIFVCNASPGGNQLWNNNADGIFTNIAASAGIECAGSTSVMALAGDLDGDRDTDLIILRERRPARVFINELLGKYHEVECGAAIEGDLGGALQDFNGDGLLDVLALGGNPARLHLYLGDGHAHFHEDTAFGQSAAAASTWGALRGFRTADIDLDGDLDIVLISSDAHVLLNDGAGHFVLRPQFWKSLTDSTGVELCDFNGDFVPDLLQIQAGSTPRITGTPGKLDPAPSAFAISLSGMRGRDKRTRSPASGFGAAITVRTGLREQSCTITGQSGGLNQSASPAVFGLGGAKEADYVRVLWSDGVAQVETAMTVGQTHKITELQRKTSSCPVLFSWNGGRFECITDFAGVGGLGYFIAPGEFAQPQPLDYVKIEPSQLQSHNGVYELRITEPMEESAYIDQLQLLIIDHPSDWRVFPDERLAVTGPAPTHELLAVEKPIYPLKALDPSGRDCTESLKKTDRSYAYEPKLDRRFFGFCAPHSLELDFGGQLSSIAPSQRLFLFISGYLEYPYSQTTYAANQARVSWEPIRIDRMQPDGSWKTIVADAGAFGGMARTMTVDLTGLLGGSACRLRLTSNLEIYYDQLFLAPDADHSRVKVQEAAVISAELGHAGFAREYSPDGRLPLLYDYSLSDASAPFHVLRGAYTRYGPVKELLQAFDDIYAILGPGDEIAIQFDAASLQPPPAGFVRSFILASHAYCKDMDLYTATPQTLEPLPFRGMSRYPYPSSEKYPDTAKTRKYREMFNTRIIE